MPKFEKERKKASKSQKNQGFDQDLAFKSLVFTLFVGSIFFILSILFNVVDILSVLSLIQHQLIEILDIGIKVITPVLFFLFILTSVGNYKDLLGKPADWKEITFLFCLSLFQTVRNTIAFGLTLVGLILVVLYFYIIQED
ncbi:MAG: hypothetical protein ACFFBP_06860 [Promethearchaeota archaeon]